MWKRGVIGIPDGKGKYVSCKYSVKCFEKGSSWGINNGRISKLHIKINDVVVCNYDRGWDIEPINEVAEQALAILLKEYN